MELSAGLTVLALAFSASIDNFGVGISYGIRKIRISAFANLMIAVIAFFFSLGGILFGQWISLFLPGVLSNIAGPLVLFVIGLRIALLAAPHRKKQRLDAVEESEANTCSLKLNHLLSSPEKADMDQSGHISFVEALVLGTAVSLNALTNGLGAGMIGLSPFWIAFTAAVGSYLSIWGGVKAGQKVADVRIGSWSIGRFSTFISGMILVLVGLGHLL